MSRRPRRRHGEESPETIWLRPEPARRRARRQIDVEDITRTALSIADAQGPDAVSMRNVAAALNVGTMTLYSYVQSKDDLLDLMQDAVMAELVVPGELPHDWRAAMREIAVRSHAAFLRHPWLATSAGRRPSVGPNAMRHIEQSLAAVAGMGLDDGGMLAVIAAVDDYVIGHAFRRVTFEASRREFYAPYIERMLAKREFPNLERLYRGGFGNRMTDPERFERGLDWLLEGIAAELTRRRRGRRG
ncbi:MAG TPA: TetR/AcrR family transcriptional regulator [Gaiellales bacterium]|nr:TetR/AcrR family transcriptional regulator [Gaiellales bacterium]